MLLSVRIVKDYHLKSKDGQIGRIRDLYFDDQYWSIRYLIVDTGNWLNSKQVLIPPTVLRAADASKKLITVDLTRKQIEDCPPLSSDRPVSQQFPRVTLSYYGMPVYWDGSDSTSPADAGQPVNGTNPGGREWNPHLMSTNDVAGHHVQGLDGEVGHIDDYIIDDGSWVIRYLVVDTRNWWPGNKVLISPQWIRRIDWSEKKVVAGITCNAIRQSPVYSDEALLTRNYESELYRHYNMPGYWNEVLE